jgi:hypothetical protein
MDETSGTTVEDVKGNNNGTASGTTIIDGKYRKARSFDGTDDYVALDMFFNSPLDKFTVTSWVKIPTNGGDWSIVDFDRSEYFTCAAGIPSGSYSGEGNYVGFHTTDEGGTIDDMWSSATVRDENWHFISWVFDSSEINDKKIYIDGNIDTLKDAYATGTKIGHSGVTRYGFIGDGSEATSFNGTRNNIYYEGIIDEVLIFNTSLTQTQIENLYNISRPVSNPSDTLYAIQISTDNFVSDIRYIDGSTNEPKNSVTLNDFRTKSQWESETFNILGLQEGTQYYLRIIALHGDFTQTEEGPPETATTGQASCSFDIDIADESGTTAETDPPFNITFTGDNALLAGAGTVVADNLVWMDAETNGSGGFAIVQRGKNGGLYSPTLAAQINSVNGDLDTLSEGFGLQNYYIDYATDTGLGTITAESNYNGSVSNVGIVDTDWNKVYDSSGPTVTGRMALYVMARAGSDKQGATDYQESITFILVPRY